VRRETESRSRSYLLLKLTPVGDVISLYLFYLPLSINCKMNRQDEKYISGYQNTSHNIDPLAWTRGEKVEAGDVDEASNLIPKKNSPNNRSILLGSYLLITIFFALFVYYLCFKQLFSHRMAFVTTGTRINFKSVDGRFVRVDGERTNTLILSENIPWIAGSTFEVFVLPDGAWKLKS